VNSADIKLIPDEERSDLLRCLQAAPAVADRSINFLVRCLDHSKDSSRVYARRHRIKTEEGIEDKVHRKRNIDLIPDYKWSKITDVVGIRFITLYRNDIFQVTETILMALCGVFEGIQPQDFNRVNLKEFRLFVSNTHPKSDILINKIDGLVKRIRKKNDAWKYLGPEEGERYSSVHFVTSLDRGDGGLKIPIEIQVRSVFEDAWGEVDHTVLYEPKREGRTQELEVQHAQRQSSAFKKMMDAASDFADAMRSLVKQDSMPVTNVRPSIESAKYVEQCCKKMGLDRLAQERLLSIIGAREALDTALIADDISAKKSDYIKYANELNSFARDHGNTVNSKYRHSDNSDVRQIRYISAVEEAICRILSDDSEQLQLAVDLLEKESNEFSEFPVLWLRLGEACGKILELREWGPNSEDVLKRGRHAFEQAIKSVENLPNLNKAVRPFAATDTHEAYVRDSAGRLQAYLIWRAEKRRRGNSPPDAGTARAAIEAYSLSKKDFGRVLETDARLRLANGIVFYAAEAVEVAQAIGESVGQLPSGSEVEPFLNILENALAHKAQYERIQVLDTIAYGRSVFFGSAAAKDAAADLLNTHCGLLLDQIGGPPGYFREQVALSVQRALRIVGVPVD
jgi:ppGpp synthetase/RelA/SpoT-type nucleotidyltranferase